uniref:Secreted protein n=1 Tax=Trichogramma kaykai TaxID=54128 RepID=A0ABD2XN40_9HYME
MPRITPRRAFIVLYIIIYTFSAFSAARRSNSPRDNGSNGPHHRPAHDATRNRHSRYTVTFANRRCKGMHKMPRARVFASNRESRKFRIKVAGCVSRSQDDQRRRGACSSSRRQQAVVYVYVPPRRTLSLSRCCYSSLGGARDSAAGTRKMKRARDGDGGGPLQE